MADRVLFVCHANLCRSPMAEHLARRLLADRPVTVASAGTDAMDGLGMHPYAMEVVAESGADAASFRTRGLRPPPGPGRPARRPAGAALLSRPGPVRAGREG
ncbi:hypothetical protein AB0J84_31165, partial [Micromonospora arborensis]